MNKIFLIQALKYGIVGVLNTLLTAVVIWIMMHPVFQTDKMGFVPPIVVTISNITGYIAGLINSFVFNRLWTFKSKNKWISEFFKFVKAFLICYIPQLILVNLLNTYTNILIDLKIFVINHADTCQLIGIVFYTSFNFLINKYYTFKQTNE
jgi:putative flippase GtrA